MNRPNEFIINSQFPTQKNESGVHGSITILGGTTVSPGSTATGSVDLNTGTIGALTRGRITSSRDNNPYVTQAITYNRMGTTLGVPTPYLMVAFMYRTSPTVLTFRVLIKNQTSDVLTVQSGNETIDFNAAVFRAPYA